MAKLMLSAHYIPIVGEGKARWNNVHVTDLSDVYLLLVEAAVAQKQDPELWGARAYYLAENGEHVWGELAEFAGKRAQALGFVEHLEKRTLCRAKALEQAGFEAESWGMNSRGRAGRARKILGWQPHQPSLEDDMDEILNSEKTALGARR
jgi:nucleoside-diphosphate-sugar epimerase